MKNYSVHSSSFIYIIRQRKQSYSEWNHPMDMAEELPNYFSPRLQQADRTMSASAAQYEKKALPSYWNPVSHMDAALPEYEQLLSCQIKTWQSALETFFSITESNIISGWLYLFICRLLPFSTVENRTHRNHEGHEPISVPTIITYFQKLTEATEKKLLIPLNQN